MSYQQTYRTVSNPVQPSSYSPSPVPSIHRKPANYASSLRSISPMPPPNPQFSDSRNQLYSPTPQTPLSSNPPHLGISPSITPDIAPPAPEPQSTADRPLYRSASTATTTTTNAPDRPLYAFPTTTSASHSLPAPRPHPSTSPSPSSSTTTNQLRPITTQEIDDALRHCLRIQSEAVTEHGKRPFAALLLGPDNVAVLASHNSISHYQHAESELARLAAVQFGQPYLGKCTLVSTWEPCAMCAGTIYWTGIGRVLYAASEAKLKELTGSNNDENMTMSLPCRTIFEAGQRKVEVVGPTSSWEAKVVEEAAKWWKEHQGGTAGAAHTNGFGRSTSSARDNASIHSKRTSVTIYNPEDSLLGSIGEDGEYQADLKIDWMP